MNAMGWFTAAVLALAGAVTGMAWAILRQRKQITADQALRREPAKGDRPKVLLVVDDIVFDLSESGVRLPDNDQGLAVWQFTGPARLINDDAEKAYVKIPFCPPGTVVKVELNTKFD